MHVRKLSGEPTSSVSRRRATGVKGARTRPADRRSVDLDVLEIMLDLDPGMLDWTPPQTYSYRAVER